MENFNNYRNEINDLQKEYKSVKEQEYLKYASILKEKIKLKKTRNEIADIQLQQLRSKNRIGEFQKASEKEKLIKCLKYEHKIYDDYVDKKLNKLNQECKASEKKEEVHLMISPQEDEKINKGSKIKGNPHDKAKRYSQILRDCAKLGTKNFATDWDLLDSFGNGPDNE